MTELTSVIDSDQSRIASYLLQDGWRSAYELRSVFVPKNEVLDDLREKTGVVFVAGGAATRARKEIVENPIAERIATELVIDPDKSRALTPVPNLFHPSEFPLLPVTRITTLDYSLWAVSSVVQSSKGRNLTIVYGQDRDVAEMEVVCNRWGLSEAVFVKQHVHPGKVKPAGHADALMGLREKLIYPYTLTLYNSDVTDPNIISEAYALDLMCDLSAVMGSVHLENPVYPFEIDAHGIPTGRMGHNKLADANYAVEAGPSNNGTFSFRTAELLKALSHYDRHFEQGSYHEVGREELAIDHIVSDLCRGNDSVAGGNVRQLCIYNHRTIDSPAKCPTKIPGYMYGQLNNLLVNRHRPSEAGYEDAQKIYLISQGRA